MLLLLLKAFALGAVAAVADEEEKADVVVPALAPGLHVGQL